MITGILVGAALGIAFILMAKRFRARSWIFSAALILLPFVYVAFALGAEEWDTAVLELSFGAPFIIAGAVFLTFRSPISVLAVGLLWVIHAAFGISHDRLLLNSGVPGWYPLFCATLDVVIGFYVIWLASTLPVSEHHPSGSAVSAVPTEPAHR